MKRDKKRGLEYIAGQIHREIEKEIEEAEARAESVKLPADYEEKMDLFIRNLMAEENQKNLEAMAEKAERKPKKRAAKHWLRTAAVFALVFVAVNGAALGTSDAYRDKVFSLFYDKEQGGVTFVFDAEGEMVEDWSDYWAPGWLPEGFQLYATEQNEVGNFMVFQDDKDQYIRITEYVPETQISFDTDTLEMEEVSVRLDQGYYFEDEEHSNGYILWQPGDAPITIEFTGPDSDKEALIRIAESMTKVE